MKPRDPRVKPVARWTWSERAGFGGLEFVSHNPLLAEDDGPEGEAKALRYGLTHRPEATRDFESFARLFAAAFAQRVGAGLPSSGPPPGTLEIGPEPETRPAAQAAWDRLEVYRRHAQDLQAALQEILNSKRQAGQPRVERTQDLAERILLLFARRNKALDDATRLERRLQDEFCNLLVGRHGPDDRWESFKPDEEPIYLGSTPPRDWILDWLRRLSRSASPAGPTRKEPPARARPLPCRRPRGARHRASRDP